MLKKVKDAALSKGAKIAINAYIKEYGKMLKLNLDSKNKSITLEVLLEGEKEPLAVDVRRYELTEENGRHLLKIYGIHTSRAWINTVGASYLEGKAFEIPEEYAKMLKVIV
ncbi:hypothetical protein YH65_06855 [Sulfurovum lithotrophicum]|uniref:Uncharacterized protein n=1 Tax=Sulfurovum lithotrophicum TaxID=206403 RepID=A0A7U4M1L1_9BACT|nr:hypothetical protein [Sulfurovum lithotrophicum]AKF25142.1 hypothetical protein YH65_06855 [Sulfurovum lithotrophicum]